MDSQRFNRLTKSVGRRGSWYRPLAGMMGAAAATFGDSDGGPGGDTKATQSVLLSDPHPSTDKAGANPEFLVALQPRSPGSFVAGFKSSVVRHIDMRCGARGQPVWQTNYHEHIVRNEAAIAKIWDYIEHNPTN